MFDVDRAWETVIAVLLAVAGGLARLLNGNDNSRMRWGMIFSQLFISGFAGLMVLMLARATGLSGSWLGVLSGVSGWIGTRVLDLVAKAVGRTIGLDIDGPSDKSAG